ENGLLVPPGNVDALAAAAARLLEDLALRTRLGVVARETARRDYSPAAEIKANLEIYRGLV
ncbi:MAG: glycosyltransferase family 1 protein, partial [Oscillochloris sp.]|nr:glycosyltransferase family 1 protein [Oscillochloris sp.]